MSNNQITIEMLSSHAINLGTRKLKLNIIKNILNRLPRAKRYLKPVYYFVTQTPPVSYASITKDLIQKCIGNPDPIILEIGCNDGTHTLWFLEMFEKPTIYCFEPDPRAISRFKKNVGQRYNVQLFEIALSDHTGDITFYQSSGHWDAQQAETLPEGWDLSGSIRKPKDILMLHPWCKFDHSISVKTMTLDAWRDEHGIKEIDFIWMDVQGAEMDVFRGGVKTLTDVRFIYTEYCEQELYEGQASLKQLLKQLSNFEVLIRYPDDVLLRNKNYQFAFDKELHQIFLHPNR